jgi:transcriptional regulator with XRE-family HTH domain
MNGLIDENRVAANLKSARVRAGLLQADAAEKLGVSRATIIRYETDPSRITFQRFKELANVYGCSVSYFFGV